MRRVGCLTRALEWGNSLLEAANTCVRTGLAQSENRELQNLKKMTPNLCFICLLWAHGNHIRGLDSAGSMVVSGCSVFFIALLHNSTQSLVMSCVFSAISVMGWNALDVLQMELYPTRLR